MELIPCQVVLTRMEDQLPLCSNYLEECNGRRDARWMKRKCTQKTLRISRINRSCKLSINYREPDIDEDDIPLASLAGRKKIKPYSTSFTRKARKTSSSSGNSYQESSSSEDEPLGNKTNAVQEIEKEFHRNYVSNSMRKQYLLESIKNRKVMVYLTRLEEQNLTSSSSLSPADLEESSSDEQPLIKISSPRYNSSLSHEAAAVHENGMDNSPKRRQPRKMALRKLKNLRATKHETSYREESSSDNEKPSKRLKGSTSTSEGLKCKRRETSYRKGFSEGKKSPNDSSLISKTYDSEDEPLVKSTKKRTRQNEKETGKENSEQYNNKHKKLSGTKKADRPTPQSARESGLFLSSKSEEESTDDEPLVKLGHSKRKLTESTSEDEFISQLKGFKNGKENDKREEEPVQNKNLESSRVNNVVSNADENEEHIPPPTFRSPDVNLRRSKKGSSPGPKEPKHFAKLLESSENETEAISQKQPLSDEMMKSVFVSDSDSSMELLPAAQCLKVHFLNVTKLDLDLLTDNTLDLSSLTGNTDCLYLS